MKVFKRKARHLLKQIFADIPVLLIIIGIGVLLFMALAQAL